MIRVVISAAAALLSTPLNADIMSVQDLQNLLERGQVGELAAVSYVQGVVDGMLAIDSLHQRDANLPPEFCRFYESAAAGSPEDHPAQHTKELVRSWAEQGRSMETIAVDMVLAHLDATYGCE